uniref:Uncharacterized protein n=1 Tax=Octopus bimaculoides TaxID=37653 RepID=A0A0L8FWQ7_OCTBM
MAAENKRPPVSISELVQVSLVFFVHQFFCCWWGWYESMDISMSSSICLSKRVCVIWSPP